MGRQYAPKIFLRQVPNHLLHAFFAQRHALSEIPWQLLDEKKIEVVYDAWQALPAPQRLEIDREFQAVHEMACEGGVQALIAEGAVHSLDLAAALERHEGFYNKAMWAYLYHPPIFAVASLFVSADDLPTRYWLKLKGLSRKAPETSPAATRALEEGLSEYYRTTQGRGHRCTVETYLRGGRQQYYFAYPDDYADTFIGHDEQGSFVKRPQKRAFEVVFVYDRQAGTLDLHAKGDRGVKARLLYIFCTAILRDDPPPEQPGDHPYELNGLLSRDFPFATDPEDGIESVHVLKLRLSLGNTKRRVTLEADPNAGPQDIFDMMTDYLNAKTLASSAVNVTQAEFRLHFVPKGYARQKPLTFSVSFPNASNLKSLSEDHRLLAEKYLKRWGIERE
jgi:hypothetical protein